MVKLDLRPVLFSWPECTWEAMQINLARCDGRVVEGSGTRRFLSFPPGSWSWGCILSLGSNFTASMRPSLGGINLCRH